MTTSDYRAQIYERYLSTRDVPEDSRGMFAFYQQVVRRHFPAARDVRIVDLGCGSGTLVHTARQLSYTRIRGIDISVEQVAAARQLGIEDITTGEAIQWLKETTAGSLGAVVSFDLIEHLTKPEVMELADEVHRALDRGGRWIIHSLNGESPMVGRALFGDLTHQQAFTTESMTQVLKAAGFGQMSFFEDAPAVHGLLSAGRWIWWKIFRTAIAFFLAAESGISRGIFSQNFLTVAIKN